MRLKLPIDPGGLVTKRSLLVMLGGICVVLIIFSTITLIKRWQSSEPNDYRAIGHSESRPDGAWRLTTASGKTSYQNACFSPDSTQLVATRWHDGYNQGAADLVLYDLSTGAERTLLADGEFANVNVPFGCWREKTIVFASDRSGRDEIWTIDIDDQRLQQITHHTDDDSYSEPVFSPDGRRIVFEIDRDVTRGDEKIGEIAVIDRTGDNLVRLTDAADTDDRLPSWSSADKLLFQRRARTGANWSDWDVFTIEPVGENGWSTPSNLTDQSTSEETDNSWDPHARFLISSSDHGELSQPNIFAFPVSGGEPVRLTTSSDREDGAPSISPDGQWLAFESHRTAKETSPSDIWLKRLDGSSLISNNSDNRWQPTPGLTFQWQLSELPIATSVEADIYEIDGLDNAKSVVDELHAQGRKVICYVNVGAWEDFRDDKDAFPAAVLGKVYQGWEDERWLDIRQIDLLAPILRERFDACRKKDFDAVEADNVDGFEQETGFPLTVTDQLRFNRWVAQEIRARGMAAALKNDGVQAAELVGDFDLVVTEDCIVQDVCADYTAFHRAGKLHLNAEYTDTAMRRETMCDSVRASGNGMTSVLKHRDLGRYRETCSE